MDISITLLNEHDDKDRCVLQLHTVIHHLWVALPAIPSTHTNTLKHCGARWETQQETLFLCPRPSITAPSALVCSAERPLPVRICFENPSPHFTNNKCSLLKTIIAISPFWCVYVAVAWFNFSLWLMAPSISSMSGFRCVKQPLRESRSK